MCGIKLKLFCVYFFDVDEFWEGFFVDYCEFVGVESFLEFFRDDKCDCFVVWKVEKVVVGV